MGNAMRSVKFHFQSAEPYYITFAVALVSGICAGIFTFGCLGASLVSEVGIIISNYYNALSYGFITSDVIYEGIKNSLIMSLVLYVCSFTPLAVASGVVVLAAKGFCIGFAATGVLKCFALKNSAMLLLQSTPYQLLSIAALLLMAGVGAMYQKSHRTAGQNTLLFIMIYLLFVAGIICEVLIKC